MTASAMSAPAAKERAYSIPFVIAASSAGTVIEWYDFYLYGVLAAFFAPQFFPAELGQTGQLLSSLATFGVGFAVRPPARGLPCTSGRRASLRSIPPR